MICFQTPQARKMGLDWEPLWRSPGYLPNPTLQMVVMMMRDGQPCEVGNFRTQSLTHSISHWTSTTHFTRTVDQGDSSLTARRLLTPDNPPTASSISRQRLQPSPLECIKLSLPCRRLTCLNGNICKIATFLAPKPRREFSSDLSSK
jgi:hypothetical protein